jgi:citrate synthase
MQMTTAVAHGLEGIVAASTRLSRVDGEKGELLIAGYPAEEIAPRATYEEMLFLLLNDLLPTEAELSLFQRELAAKRVLPSAIVQLLRAAAATRMEPMLALRAAVGALDLEGKGSSERERAIEIAARIPVIAASYGRLLEGNELLESRTDLSHAANFLWLLRGVEPQAAAVRALDTYLNTVIDHGMNASTFTARVIISTGSDLVSAVTGAIGSLAGPLHGGAPGPVLEMLQAIGAEENIDSWLSERISRNERLMGFGHRIYKVRDPRADILAAAAEKLYGAGEQQSFYRFARRVEERALVLLEQHKPGRRLQTNVEFYTALLLHGLGLPAMLFSPLFAVGRVGGWLAHAFEQRSNNRIFRPESAYNGAEHRKWVDVAER